MERNIHMLLKKIYTEFIQKKKKETILIKESIELLENASQEMEQYYNKNDYLYEFDYCKKKVQWEQLADDVNHRMSNPIIGLKKLLYGLAVIQGQYKQKYSEYRQRIDEIETEVGTHNIQYMKSAVAKAYKIIGDIEGKPLDTQQMECIVKNPKNQLVIAGAGTGKTTTIIGKVKFLLGNKMCHEDEICVLSFTKAAATEMENRLYAQTNVPIHVSTFHSLGLDILRKSNIVAPAIYNGNLHKFIIERIQERLKEPEYAALLMTYLLFHRVEGKSEFDFTDERTYQEYLETNPPTTILGERVKSYGEMEIANFFSQHGIRYQYEESYLYDTRTEDFDQYHPDFYLPDYCIYVEYFGINRANKVPAYFKGRDGKSASQIYCEGIEWKRNIHQKHNTILIECYAYDHMEGKLLDKLKEDLLGHKVPLQEIQIDDMLQHLSEGRNRFLDGMADIMQTVISLAKGKQMNSQDLISVCTAHNIGQIPLAKLIEPVMEDYENYLQQQRQIDFADMLNLAAEAIEHGKYYHKYKYIIVDEYQDLSSGQYRLLRAMRKEKDYTLFCVGDDWQSIYRFNGSDIGYILHFSQYWGDTEVSRIETTYRFPQRLVEISGRFIMRNSNQLIKYIRSGSDEKEKYVLSEIKGYQEKNAIKFMVDQIAELPLNSSVYFIGRYKFDSDILKTDSRLKVYYDNVNQNIVFKMYGREDLKMEFYTAHRSKGLQADYVFIINNKNTGMGFPSKIQNPPLVELLLEQADGYSYAEERRLFYVALTRAKKRVYMVTVEDNLSVFAKELVDQYHDEIRKCNFLCPLCGASLRKIDGKYGTFWGCTNYRRTGCSYKRKVKS